MTRLMWVTLAGVFLGLSAAGTALGQARLFEDPGPCDRECLIGLVDTYLGAIVLHDPLSAPLSANLRFTENTELMPPGEGLWKTASAVPTSFRVYVPDPVAGQVGFIGIMEDSDEPIQLGLRLKVEDGEITEAEHIVVRNLSEGSLQNLSAPRPALLATVPPDERVSRELMLAIGQTYYDSIEQSDGDAAPFADDCERRENGMITAGGDGTGLDGLPRQGCRDQMFTRVFTYIDDIDLRRVWIADEVTGLVFGLSHFRHSMEDRELDVYGRDGELTTREVSFEPFDLPAMHVFKVRGGRIHEIEALGVMRPYMSANGWNDFLR
jgi:hypothetical protein